MFTVAFWKDASERAVKTAAQALLSLWVVADGVFDVLTVDVTNAIGVAGGAAVLSYLSSIVSAKVAREGTASAVKEVAYEGETSAL